MRDSPANQLLALCPLVHRHVNDHPASLVVTCGQHDESLSPPTSYIIIPCNSSKFSLQCLLQLSTRCFLLIDKDFQEQKPFGVLSICVLFHVAIFSWEASSPSVINIFHWYFSHLQIYGIFNMLPNY